MYLKSLTLRGFKSFASSTTLQFEPGITCVVGPNGSGKSNVVDAIAWVMGEQGAKSLRGGKMEDVIFAGTTGRAPLGRAEVVLTIDNGDGALPLEYSEVTISRTMFRNGGSEYAINGRSCRLLDIQELLSDSGIGREMHVIVGQGRLDSILHATPEDRRGFIEEAAGVLKHRKRKEKALRKLTAAEDNVTRLQDLLTEVRRQLKPLGKQAEAARKAAVIQADVRDAKLRLLADDLSAQRTELAKEMADENAVRERRTEVESSLTEAKQTEAVLDEQLRADGPRVRAARETAYELSGLAERFRSTASLAAERGRHLAEAMSESHTGRARRDPEEMDTEAALAREERDAIAEEVETHSEVLERAVEHRRLAEEAASAEERRIAEALRVAADRREGLARLAGQVSAAESRLEARQHELNRLTEARSEAVERSRAAEEELAVLREQVDGLDAGDQHLEQEHETARTALREADESLNQLREQERDTDRERAAVGARKEALELSLGSADGAAALLERDQGELLGPLSGLVEVRDGWETAVAAALGRSAEAVAVRDLAAAARGLTLLRTEDLGQAALLIGDAPRVPEDEPAGWPALPPGARYAIEAVGAPDGLRPALCRALRKVALVSDAEAARALVADRPDVLAVTRDGDLLGAQLAYGGSAGRQSQLEAQAAVDEATARLEHLSTRIEQLAAERTAAEAVRAELAERAQAVEARRKEAEARQTAISRQLAERGSTVRAATAEVERMDSSIEQAGSAIEAESAKLAELQERHQAAEFASDEEPDTTQRDELASAASEARQEEMEARLGLRTAEERLNVAANRAESLQRAADEERAAAERERVRARQRERQAVIATAVRKAAERFSARLEHSLAAATEWRERLERAQGERERQVKDCRERVRTLETELATLTATVHRDEMARAEQRLRIQQLEDRALEELGMDPDALIEEYGPDVPVPIAAAESTGAQSTDAGDNGDEGAADGAVPTKPFVRAEQEKRLRSAERQLSLLGKVNPLALEEYEAMEERHKFLSEQLQDLQKSRKDLMEIVREVDERVEKVFTEAWEDTREQFERVFARLFPGGEGRLLLTDPGNMLETGVDVEARPPGKKVKRLSLLSGGERSLVAVAFLVALFKARPSPFYLLDEVEAALDDTNLGRLLELYEELRATSQLLVVTHQKRTMEVGDALYGVSMRGDGVSAVISQRLRDS